MQFSCQKTNSYFVLNPLSLFIFQSPSMGDIWKQSLITGPEHNPVKSFLGRALKLDHKPKAQRNCSQILAHPMDAAAWARLIESPSTLYLLVKPKSSLRSSCWWYRRGMRNCSGSRGTLVSHPSHLLTKGNPTWGEEVTDFLAKYPIPAAVWGTNGERWTCVRPFGLICASAWLCLGSQSLPMTCKMDISLQVSFSVLPWKLRVSFCRPT